MAYRIKAQRRRRPVGTAMTVTVVATDNSTSSRKGSRGLRRAHRKASNLHLTPCPLRKTSDRQPLGAEVESKLRRPL